MVESPIAQRQFSRSQAARQFTVLIVEDDDSQLYVLSRRLENLGFNILSAKTGAEALEMARRRHPSLILMDLGLPDMDGLTVSEQLADDMDTCGVPIIVVSASDQTDIVRSARTAGCTYFVRKPYDPNALLLLIEHSLYGNEPLEVGELH